MTVETRIQSSRVLLPDGFLGAATLTCVNGRIEQIDAGGCPDAAYDAGDLLLVPGIVDLHGDAFERQINPRPRASVPVEVGLLETDRQMIANGITTAFHGLTVTWEPGTRDIQAARAILQALDRVNPRLRCDTKLHLRHEALSLDTVDESCSWIRDGRIALVAINDHREMIVRSLAKGVSRDSVSIAWDEYTAMARHALSRDHEVPASIEKLTALAREFGIPLASHDDETPEARASYRFLGCTMCEFPADQATSEAAREAGDHIILGSPNILRGGSHCGRVGAAEMIRQGLCSILCSDYYYPSVLVAPFLLAAQGIVPFATAWDLVSRGPADAARLSDRGTLTPGKRADLIFIDDGDPLHPEVRAAFVEGVPAYTRGVTFTARQALSLEGVLQ